MDKYNIIFIMIRLLGIGLIIYSVLRFSRVYKTENTIIKRKYAILLILGALLGSNIGTDILSFLLNPRF